MTVGAQFAYWRDYERSKRFSMVWKWHVVMPLLTRLIGYFPAKRLRWMEDTPKGVALDWSRMGPRFEDTVRHGQMRGARRESDCLRDRFQQVTAPILAISLTDDEYGTVAAVERLLAYFDCSERQHLRIAPQDIGHAAIGHFAFFHDRYRDTLWPLALDWLQQGQTSADFCTHPFPR
jgi:predicted alpha/beta hydrolase